MTDIPEPYYNRVKDELHLAALTSEQRKAAIEFTGDEFLENPERMLHICFVVFYNIVFCWCHFSLVVLSVFLFV
jgi:hypothetical protein